MRVISGSAKGRRLKSVPGETTRPVLDRVKTTVFDILRPNLSETLFLDLFAGSGGIGIEALSQGAERCVFLDLAKPAIETIRENLKVTELEEQSEVRCADAFGFLRRTQQTFDIIYVAPPQYEDLWTQALFTIAERPDLVSPEGVVIAQIHPQEYESLQLTDFTEQRTKKIGNTLLVFYQRRRPST